MAHYQQISIISGISTALFLSLETLDMLESTIEKKVTKYAESLGWWSSKFTSPSNRGVPDHLYLKNGVTVFIEYKQLGKQLRTLQEFRIRQMRDHGATVHVVDSINAGKAVFDAY
jgi:hypothetical protein